MTQISNFSNYQLTVLLSIVMTTLVLSSCNNNYYVPTDDHFVQLTKQGDLNVSASVGRLQNSGTVYSGQIGFSPIENFALATNFQRVLGDNQIEPTNTTISPSSYQLFSNGVWDKGYTAGGALGMYYFMRPKATPYYYRDGFLLDFYFGYSRSNIQNKYPTNGATQLDYNKMYGQLGFHYLTETSKIKRNKNDLSFGTSILFKFGNLSYKKLTIISDIDSNSSNYLEVLNEKNPFTFFETTFSFQMGYKNITGFANYNIFSVLERNITLEENQNLQQNAAIIRFGLFMELNNLFKSSKNRDTETPTNELEN